MEAAGDASSYMCFLFWIFTDESNAKKMSTAIGSRVGFSPACTSVTRNNSMSSRNGRGCRIELAATRSMRTEKASFFYLFFSLEDDQA